MALAASLLKPKGTRGNAKAIAPAPALAPAHKFPAAIRNAVTTGIGNEAAKEQLLVLLREAAGTPLLRLNRGYPRSGPRGLHFSMPNGRRVTVKNSLPYSGRKNLPFKGNSVEPEFENRIAYQKGLEIYEDIQSPGVYTWILYMFEDDAANTLRFAAMRVTSVMEYGSGHESIVRSIQESTGRSVLVIFSGEMRMAADGNITFNLLSGSFMMKVLTDNFQEKYGLTKAFLRSLNTYMTSMAQEFLREVLHVEVLGNITLSTYITANAVPLTEEELAKMRGLRFVTEIEPMTASGGAGATRNLTGGRHRSLRKKKTRKYHR